MARNKNKDGHQESQIGKQVPGEAEARKETEDDEVCLGGSSCLFSSLHSKCLVKKAKAKSFTSSQYSKSVCQ